MYFIDHYGLKAFGTPKPCTNSYETFWRETLYCSCSTKEVANILIQMSLAQSDNLFQTSLGQLGSLLQKWQLTTATNGLQVNMVLNNVL